MKFRKKRSILIKRKYIRIFVPILVAMILFVVIMSVSTASKEQNLRQQAIDNITNIGIINVGLRGDLGALCSYNTETGSFEGLEKDIADEIITRLFSDDILVNYIQVNSETKDALLRFGDLDLALGASLQKEISGVCYTSSYYADGSAFLVMEGQMTNEKQLSGRTIAVVQGSFAAWESEETEDTTRMDDYLAAHDINASVKMYASYPEAIEALRTGLVGGVCANEIFLKQHGKKGMLILPERFMPHRFSVETRTALGKFCEVVSDTIEEMRSDGTLKSLYEKWNLVDYATLEG